ncbi:SpoIIE family protein phosphatase [Streptomyces sp. NBC_00063]|uniref:SpoIIE family protein phosphatase n=1 Tax=Streptomyces sp. NBC_00063 TaxID=2975638 RepID=UPI003D74C568
MNGSEAAAVENTAFLGERALGLAAGDSRGLLTMWDGAAPDILGYRADELIGRPVTELIELKRDLAAVAAELRDCAGGGSLRHVLTARHRDGHRAEIMARVWPIAAEGGRNWLAIFTAASELRRWDTDRATVDGLFSQAPIGLAVFDPDLRFIRINDALQKIHGIPRDKALGRRITALFPGPEAERMEERIRQVLETGEPVTKEHRAPTPTLQGWNRDWSITSFRLCDPAGKVLGAASAVVEVTERNRARDRLVLLNEASERIGTTLDVTRTAAELTEVAVPRLADFIAVDLLEGIALGEESVPGPVGGDAVLRRAAIRSVHEDAPEASYAPGALITFHAATPQAQALATGEAVLLPTLEGTADWLTHDLHRAGKMTEAGVHSVMVVPLCARDVTLGVAHFYRWRRPDPFEADDLAAAGEVVARAAVCVDNARRFTHERHAALTLQQSLLQVTQPELSAVTTAHRYVPAGGPAGVGGDWFDIIPLSGARVGLIVGDVPGRGVHAVAEAGRLRTAVRALAQQDPAPDELLAQLDGIVSQSAAPEQTCGSPTAGIGGSCLYAVYDPVSRRCTLASAGHFPPVQVRPDGTGDFLDVSCGPPLGLGGMPFATTEVELPEGSVLALYTNGLLCGESGRGDVDAALRRLRRTLARPDGRLDSICDAVLDALVPHRTPADDAVLLLALTHALGPDRVATWDLPLDPAVVSQARALTASQLTAWNMEDLAFTTELIVSELVTNAIRYARAPIQLRLIRTTTLICEVADGSSTSPHMRQASDTDESGRGLFMIAQMADRWGTRYSPSGKTVWAEWSGL